MAYPVQIGENIFWVDRFGILWTTAEEAIESSRG